MKAHEMGLNVLATIYDSLTALCFMVQHWSERTMRLVSSQVASFCIFSQRTCLYLQMRVSWNCRTGRWRTW